MVTCTTQANTALEPLEAVSLFGTFEFIKHRRVSNLFGSGVEFSTVTLRVVGGDEKGSLKSEIVKYGREFQGTRT
jgi:hypothetical protein